MLKHVGLLKMGYELIYELFLYAITMLFNFLKIFELLSFFGISYFPNFWTQSFHEFYYFHYPYNGFSLVLMGLYYLVLSNKKTAISGII